MKVAKKAWAVSGKPRNGGDMSAKECQENVAQTVAMGKAGMTSDATPEARRGRIGQRRGQLSFPRAVSAEGWGHEPQQAACGTEETRAVGGGRHSRLEKCGRAGGLAVQ